MSSRKTTRQRSLEIGKGVVIGSLVLLSAGTRIGKRCLIADQASIREGNEIGEDTIVGKAVTVEYSSRIGSRCKIMNGTHITGNMVVEDDVFIGSLVSTVNDNRMDIRKVRLRGPHIKTKARIGSNSTILPGIVVGRFSVVAAGAVVTKDVPDHALVMGVPARVVRTSRSGYPIV